MSEFKATLSERLNPTEVIDTSAKVRLVFVCPKCGGTRFKWVATTGSIKAGGFVPDEYTYACLGCEKTYTEADYKRYFAGR
jgi:hypothetical protein